MKNKSKNPSSLKKELAKWSKRTRLPAVTNIADSNIITKLIWIFFITLFSIILSQKILLLILNYFNFEKVTNLQLKTLGKETEFPVVTIRFTNWLNYDHFISQSGKFLRSQEEYFKTFNSGNLNEDFLSAKNKFITSYLLASLSTTQRTDLETQLANNSVVSCRFNGIKCSINDFKIAKYDNDGAFIQFNLNKQKIKNNSGLELELFIGLSETQSPLELHSGAVLFIHDDPRLIIMPDEQGIELKPGTHSNIAITRKIVKNLEEPFNFCVPETNIPPNSMLDRSLFELTINLTGFYSQKYCFELCYQNSMINNCGCFDQNLLKYKDYYGLVSCDEKFNDNHSYLENEDLIISCPYFIKESFYAADYVKKCSQLCPNECEYKKFKTVLSRSKYPSKFYSSILLRNKKLNRIVEQNGNKIDRIRLNKSILSVSVNFATDYFIQIDQVPLKTLIDLISELGENFGLFLGLSILSAVEIADLLIKILIILSQRGYISYNYKWRIISNKLFFQLIFSMKQKTISN